jgi:chromosome segregation ATPase
VSNKGPKNTKSEHSQTFRKEPEEVGSVFPPQAENSYSPIEPVFEVEAEEPEASYLEQEISALQPQVETINRTPPQESITSNQVDILRKYIALKESESHDLKEQQKQYQTHVKKLTGQLQSLALKHQEVVTDLETLKRREGSARGGVEEIEKRHQDEMTRMKNEYEAQLRRSGNVSADYKELERRQEEWKEKVQSDLKRIKLKERELENKYELLKRDTQALLDSKDKHVLELKRKSDALELEMESLEDRLRQATLTVSSIQSKKRRLLETLRLAMALIEQMDSIEELEEEEKKIG